MATYDGYKLGDVYVDIVYGNPALGNFPDPLDPSLAVKSALPVGGTRDANQPTTTLDTVTRSGYAAPHFGFLQWYNHIHFQYTDLDLGNVLNNITRTFYVWNGYFVSQTLVDIQSEGTDGLILASPGSPELPLTWAPLEQKNYLLSVSSDGPPTVDAHYSFTFDGLGTYQLNVTGIRLVLFAWQPQGGMRETLEWRTDVQEAYDGSEQRLQLRLSPRQTFEYSVLTKGREDIKLRGMLFEWLGRVFGVPVWFELRPLTAAATAGATTVAVSTLYGDFRVGGLAMIYDDADNYEVLGVDSFDATTITFTSGISRDYGTQAAVCPVRTAYLNTNVQRTRLPTEYARTRLSFQTVDNVDLADTTGATIYDGRVVLADANFLQGVELEESFNKSVTLFDSASGRLFQLDRADRAFMTTTKRWETETLQDLWRLRRLLHSFAGNRKTFWLPVWRDDLELAEAVAGGQQNLRVHNVNYTAFYGARRPYGDFQMTLADGTVYRRRIEGSNVDGATEVLTFTGALRDTAIQVADVVRIELINLVRIADDKAVLSHNFSDGWATLDLKLKAVRE